MNHPDDGNEHAVPTALDLGGDPSEIEKAVDGRTKEGRAARGAGRTASRRTAPRETADSGARIVIGRNGEQLSRTRTEVGDKFDVPIALIPSGWEYQWNSVTVHGNADVVMNQSNTMYANGWRPVEATRHDGMFMPKGHKGSIIIEGLRLDERPKVLCDDARKEGENKARRQMSDRDQALMGGKANLRGKMGDGIEMGGRYRGTGADLRMSIDPGLDIPAPSHTLAQDGE